MAFGLAAEAAQAVQAAARPGKRSCWGRRTSLRGTTRKGEEPAGRDRVSEGHSSSARTSPHLLAAAAEREPKLGGSNERGVTRTVNDAGTTGQHSVQGFQYELEERSRVAPLHRQGAGAEQRRPPSPWRSRISKVPSPVAQSGVVEPVAGLQALLPHSDQTGHGRSFTRRPRQGRWDRRKQRPSLSLCEPAHLRIYHPSAMYQLPLGRGLRWPPNKGCRTMGRTRHERRVRVGGQG